MKAIQHKEHTILVDDEDYDRIMNFSSNIWMAKYTTGSRTAYAVTRKMINGKRKQYYMHRVVMGLEHTSTPYIDHINGNTLDNRKCNLRLVERTHNMKNRSSAIGSTSKYLGVHWSKWNMKWRSVIKPTDHPNIHLGYYEHEHHAAYAYNVAAKIIHEEYANLNEIDDVLENENEIEGRVMAYLEKRGYSTKT